MKIFFNLLNAETTTQQNVLTDIANDPSKAGSTLLEWWQELDLINKFVDKIPTIVVAVFFFIAGFAVAKFAGKLVVKALEKKHVDPSVYNFIRRIVTASIKLFVVMTVASMFFDLSGFLAAIGGAGLAAGLGLQASVSQFASGLQILINHPFKTGDFVEVNGISGSVSDIRFMNTVITTADNKRIIIPNAHITSNHIINYSAENKRLINLNFGISYSDDIAKAKQVILDIAYAEELILKDPEPKVFVNSHEASAVQLVAKIWCNTENYWDTYFMMQEKVKLAFDENGISIPFNQLDVHIHQ